TKRPIPASIRRSRTTPARPSWQPPSRRACTTALIGSPPAPARTAGSPWLLETDSAVDADTTSADARTNHPGEAGATVRRGLHEISGRRTGAHRGRAPDKPADATRLLTVSNQQAALAGRTLEAAAASDHPGYGARSHAPPPKNRRRSNITEI